MRTFVVTLRTESAGAYRRLARTLKTALRRGCVAPTFDPTRRLPAPAVGISNSAR
jgi:hypothetical protein